MCIHLIVLFHKCIPYEQNRKQTFWECPVLILQVLTPMSQTHMVTEEEEYDNEMEE